jgi:hypothetical protein
MLLVLVLLVRGARELVEGARVLVLEVGAPAAVLVQLARHARRRFRARLQHARLLRQLDADVCHKRTRCLATSYTITTPAYSAT